MSRRSFRDHPSRDRECFQAYHAKEPAETYALSSRISWKYLSHSFVVTVAPKQNSIFALAVPLYSTLSPVTQTLQEQEQETKSLWTVLDKPYIEFDLHGNQFCFRSADRSNRKFKAKETIEL